MAAKLGNDASIATITTIPDADYILIVDDSTGEMSKITAANAKIDFDSGGGGPLVYAAIVSQSGSSAPVNDFDVANTTGKTFTWARTTNGTYTLTASSAFFTGLTVVTLTPSIAAFGYTMAYAFTSSTVLTIYVRSVAGTLSDSALDQATIKLEQYV